jgi:hypothetical protein
MGDSAYHIWSRAISLATLTSGTRWPFSGLTPGDITKSCFSLFYCSTHYHLLPPFPLPAFLPHSPFDVQTLLCVKEHLLGLGLHFHSTITWAAVFLSLVASMWSTVSGELSRVVSGTFLRQNVAPIKVLNPPRVENQRLIRSSGLHPFQVCTKTWANFSSCW